MLNGVAHRVSSIRAATGSRAFSRVPFRVHRGAIAPPSDPIHDNQRVECTWTIRSDVAPSSASPRRRRENAVPATGRVEKLKVLLPGITIVRVRPEMRDSLGSDAVARVRVTSNSAEVLRGVHVASRWPNRTLLGFHAPQAERELTGHLLTEIDLPHAHAVRNLAAIGLGDVVVHKDVLYAGGREDAEDTASKLWSRSCGGRHRRRHSCWGDRDLKLFAANESRLFVDASTTDMHLEGLKIGAMGLNSRVTIECGALDLQRGLGVGVVGGRDGGISISADSLIAPRLKIMAIGNGELELTARRLLEVDELKTFAMGNGVVHVHAPEATSDDVPRARTSYQATAAIGAACVDTASLAARRSKVITVGSNDLSLHARDALRVRSVGSSVVECVDRLPRQLDVRGLPQPTLIETPAGEKKTTDATDAEAKVKYPTAQDAFEREALLSTGRSRFFSRFSKSVRDCHWHGSDGSGEMDEKETWSGRRRRRRHGRWADDAWV